MILAIKKEEKLPPRHMFSEEYSFLDRYRSFRSQKKESKWGDKYYNSEVDERI